ncbi:hypothetical protein Hanom_Chr15g01393901 [Helianthus anomalus]
MICSNSVKLTLSFGNMVHCQAYQQINIIKSFLLLFCPPNQVLKIRKDAVYNLSEL